MKTKALGRIDKLTHPLIKTIIGFTLIVVFLSSEASAGEPINFEKLADAIYLAEGGAKTSHPYGILTKYKTTTPRQACINTIKHQYKHFLESKENDFILYLSRVYAPVGAKNDPKGLNKNWVKNVKYFYYKK